MSGGDEKVRRRKSNGRGEERVVKEKNERKKTKKNNFAELLAQAKRWHQSDILRDYINRFEENSIKLDAFSDEIKNWITWAREKVDWYDPYINKKDNYLIDIYRHELCYVLRHDECIVESLYFRVAYRIDLCAKCVQMGINKKEPDYI